MIRRTVTRFRCSAVALSTALLLAGSGTGAAQQSESRRLLDAGASHYHRGEIAEAIQSYENAIDLLVEQERLDEAFGATMTLGAIERTTGRFIDAAERYRRAALTMPEHARAAEAHRLAALSVADALRDASPEQRDALAGAYETLLEEHLEHWGKAETAGDVRIWLGRLLLGRGDWDGARQAVGDINAEAPQFGEKIELVAESYEREGEAIGSGDEAARRDRAAVVAGATKELLPVITGSDNRWPEAWSEVQRTAALAIARLHLGYSPGPSVYAERLLTTALAAPVKAGAGEENKAGSRWEVEARTLLIVALARNEKFAAAREQIPLLAAAEPSKILMAVEQIDETVEAIGLDDAAKRRECAAIMLPLLELAGKGGATDADTAGEIGRLRARAALAAGDKDTAIAEVAALAKASPQDLKRQIEYAVLLSQSAEREDLRAALGVWQKIENQGGSHSDAWREARRRRIELLKRLGEREEAEKLARLTALLYPGWLESASTGEGAAGKNRE